MSAVTVDIDRILTILPHRWPFVLVDRVTEVPKERWDPELYYDPKAVGRDAGRGTPSKWGGFLPPIAFDPLRYGIPPAALGSIEPTQLLALESARRALVDAGYDRPGLDHDRTAVVFGAEAGSDLSNAGVLRNTLPAYLGSLPPDLLRRRPRTATTSNASISFQCKRPMISPSG